MTNPATSSRTDAEGLPDDGAIGDARQLRFWLFAVAVLLGALLAWASRYEMNPDGMSYLDQADTWWRHDWGMAINAQWSPLYAWLLAVALRVPAVSARWEFAVAHALNFVIYLATLASFIFFWGHLIREHERRASEMPEPGHLPIPPWAWWLIGYGLFMWSTLGLIKVSVVAPDMCVAAIIFLAAGMLIRIRERAGFQGFALLGLVLGLGYWVKAPIFPLAFVFVTAAVIAAKDRRRALLPAVVALAIFLAISSPYVIALSQAKGRLTFGDSGRLSYSWFIDGTPQANWQGEPPGSGMPAHPTRKLSDAPPVYEFAQPVGGTYPPWYDPSYWNEGIKPYLQMRRQLAVLAENASLYYDLLFLPEAGLIAGALVLFIMSRRRWSCLTDLGANLDLLLPAVAGLGMYALVHVEPRYVGAFPLVAWAGILSAIRLPRDDSSRRLQAAVAVASVLLLGVALSHSIVRNLKKSADSSANPQWQIATGLKQAGIQEGDKVATIGYSFGAYWARLARVKIVAEIPLGREGSEWPAPANNWPRVVEVFEKSGARAIVTDRKPPADLAADWQRIGNSNHFVHMMRSPGPASQ